MGLSRLGSFTKHLLLILPFFIPYFSYGQKYSVGVKAAPLITWPGFGDKEAKDDFSRSIGLGYSAGILVSFPMKKDFDLFVEGGFSQRVRRLKFNDDEWVNASTYRFIDGAMLLRKSYKFRLEKNVPSYFFYNLGPEVSYWMSGKGRIIVNEPGYGYNIVFDQEPDANFRNMYLNDINRFLFGLILGVGIKSPLRGNQNISAELRFVSGHTFLGRPDSSHIEILGFEDTMKTNLKTLMLNVAYTLDFDVQKSRKGKSTLDKKIKRKKR